ncbi:hypothetical protein IscW_ISCW009600, partial [Ixodes scapularis]
GTAAKGHLLYIGRPAFAAHLTEPPPRNGPDPVRTDLPAPTCHGFWRTQAATVSTYGLLVRLRQNLGLQLLVGWYTGLVKAHQLYPCRCSSSSRARVFAPFAAAPDPGRFSVASSGWGAALEGYADPSALLLLGPPDPSVALRQPEEPLPTAPAAPHGLHDPTPAANVIPSHPKSPRNEGPPTQEATSVGLPRTAALPRPPRKIKPAIIRTGPSP